MASKVRVSAQSQKWAALGIIDAYTKMYPQATLADINKAFPKEQFATADGRGIMDTMDNLKKHAETTATNFDDNQLVEWKNTNYYLTLNDGTEIAFTISMWTKEMFEKLVSYAKLYDIEIAQYSAAEKGIGKRGSYTLEFLNGYVPPVTAAPRKSKAWIWVLIIAIIAIAILAALLARSCNKEPQIITQETIVEKVVEKEVVVHDTVFLEQIEEIEKNFNAAEFEQGKADLPEAAKFVLHDLAKVMEKNPQIKLRLEGHTSAEGDAKFNQKLSEARAQAAVDFLINHEGIDANRLEAIGFGSTQLKNTDDPMAPENRRTEFIVVE